MLARHRLIPLVVLAAMGALTFLVWRQQVRHQQSLLKRHTEDVCTQASRRLQVFVDSNLRIASIFAQRWSTHETRDFSKQRFEDFASVLLEKVRAYHGVGLVGPEEGTIWAVPAGAWLLKRPMEPELKRLIAESARPGDAVLSGPFEPSPRATGFGAMIPLARGDEPLGELVVEFQAENLINDCFHTRIRSEFHFSVRDGDRLLFDSSPGAGPIPGGGRVHSSQEFTVRNRTWRLVMAPKEEARASGLGPNLPVLLLGVILSLGLSALVYMLLRRMEMYRAARNQQAMLARKVLLAQEEERSRLSRDLHDELGQTLTAIRLEMGWLEKRISADEEGADVFRNTVRLVEQSTDELRRMCRGLRPPLLDDLGLEPAARLLADEFHERTGVEIDLDLSLDEDTVRIRPEVALCVYRILQEALNNAGRHSRAARVKVSLTAGPGELRLEVTDDGVGFDVPEGGRFRGYGLEGMMERATLVGGSVEIRSARGHGTTVVFRVPLDGADGGKQP
jgi:signal transduction histidine kinase